MTFFLISDYSPLWGDHSSVGSRKKELNLCRTWYEDGIKLRMHEFLRANEEL